MRACTRCIRVVLGLHQVRLALYGRFEVFWRILVCLQVFEIPSQRSAYVYICLTRPRMSVIEHVM